ncbi:hypothetical protein TCE0_017f03603 [Talaromyces pinophilus]|jgi:hypothetical protein|uniref:Major royal jelly protein n=1 Tax=Talaromyces pinophilus TaxID=128442 RepID=A0A6V8H213_TALPI|nr:hypothetical protein TCE0_017f03603 [Talaromyces pinophilus]
MAVALSAAFLALASVTAAFAPGLEVAYAVGNATQAISITPDGRIFLAQRYNESRVPQIVELLADNTTVLYPDASWNSYVSGDPNSDPATSFVSVDGARLGPNGHYWVVDGGAVGVNNSAKLVGVNISTDKVDRVYYLQEIIGLENGPDDVRFDADGETAYLSDINGALLVLNLTTGEGARVLNNSYTAQALFPLMFNHTLLEGSDGANSTSTAGLDQIEVSPDGLYLYYQPCQGGMYRLPTELLRASLTNATLAASIGDYAEPYALTPSTGGTTIDADGTIYVSDTNLLAIWKITSDGRESIMVQDDALLWTDQMWVTNDKKLLLPASQYRPGGNGLMALGPNYIFSYSIDAGPSPIDHP